MILNDIKLPFIILFFLFRKVLERMTKRGRGSARRSAQTTYDAEELRPTTKIQLRQGGGFRDHRRRSHHRPRSSCDAGDVRTADYRCVVIRILSLKPGPLTAARGW